MATQLFREYGKCIFVGKCAKQKQVGDNQAESSGGKHVTRARSWWKKGDVDACAAQANMHCWVHQDALFDIGLRRIGQAASTGAQSDLMDSTCWGWSCMLQLQEADNWGLGKNGCHNLGS